MSSAKKPAKKYKHKRSDLVDDIDVIIGNFEELKVMDTTPSTLEHKLNNILNEMISFGYKITQT